MSTIANMLAKAKLCRQPSQALVSPRERLPTLLSSLLRASSFKGTLLSAQYFNK